MDDSFHRLMQLDVIKDYKRVMIDGLQNSFTSLSRAELEEAIDWSIANRHVNKPAQINNNYTKQQVNGTVIDILNYIQQLEPIVTSSGVLYKKHKDAVNPLDVMIQGFLQQRSKFKKEMFKYPKASHEFEKYNLLQLLEKLNGNATYGVLGSPTSLFYNVYVASSVTRNGRSYISCSIMLFEAFLSANVKFNSLNEIMIFIDNIINEKDKRKFDDKQILDRNVTTEEVFYKLIKNTDSMIWIPTEKEMMLVWERIQNLSTEDKNRIFYKNGLYNFCELPVIIELITKILKKLDKPFMNPNKPPKIIEEELGASAVYPQMTAFNVKK